MSDFNKTNNMGGIIMPVRMVNPVLDHLVTNARLRMPKKNDKTVTPRPQAASLKLGRLFRNSILLFDLETACCGSTSRKADSGKKKSVK